MIAQDFRPGRVIVILGPTAMGKSELGVGLAEELDGEVINADALQVYRGLDIGTAKPEDALRRRVPHHLIDILEPTELFSAGEFARRARLVLRDLSERGKTAILVGGSGLYLRALLEGLTPIPRDLQVRHLLEKRLREEGAGGLHEELQKLDPESARRLPPGDRQRVSRALEVALATGKPLSEWLRDQPPRRELIAAVRIGLTLPRSILYDRITGRVEQMVERGWVDEVVALLNRGINANAPAFQAIGYRQMVRHIENGWSLERAIEDTIRATRRYAKRQVTWFRKEKNVIWIPALELPGAVPALAHELRARGGRFTE